ncbi:hypothetical protein [Kitasatospora griseola]|uniref:hypothetical protein n=1 Tax=Kitasatospora griseola TaxID=2064 RepID=UPI003827403B
MARIRPVKPETWVSETLAEVSIPAMLTFLGMTNHADDSGRHRDNAAVVYGLIWPMRDEINRAEVEDHLQQLASVGAICRYTGCDGRRYFHYPTWRKHQKIDKPSLSRLPACPHCEPERCGVCKGPCIQRAALANTPGTAADGTANAPQEFVETSASPLATLPQPNEPFAAPAPKAAPAAAGAADAAVGTERPPAPPSRKTAGQDSFCEASSKVRRSPAEASAPGSRILDPGSSSPTGHPAPGADTVSANQLIGEYVAACAERPPGSVLGHLGKVVKTLLDEGVAVDHIRTGLRRFAEIQGHPSRLPSLVNDAMNARATGLARPGIRPTLPAHQAWTNPVDAVSAYAEEL